MDWDISLEDINEILSQRCNIDELYQDLMDSLQYKTDHDVIDMSGQESTKSPASSESSWSSDDSAPPSVKKRQQNRKSPNVAHWLYGLLNDSKHSHILTWTNGRKNGEFEILKQEALAKLWGHRGSKSNDRMTYGNLARTMRYHYERSKGRELELVRRKMIYKFSRHFLEKIQQK